MRTRTIAMSAPDITDAEMSAVAEVLRSPTLSMGPCTEQFERELARFVGARHAIAVSSGTAGLHMCAVEAGVGAGDLVVTTPFSFVASANIALYQGAVPVFVDVDPTTGNLDDKVLTAALEDLLEGGSKAAEWLPPSLRGKSAGQVRAIVPVHVFGRPLELDRAYVLAAAEGVSVIEDSCEAVGARSGDRAAGTLGRHGVFAFYPNKQMTTGEGGMVVTDDDDAAAVLRSLCNQGRDVFDEWLQHSRLGYNYRMDEMSAALGVAQVERLPELLGKRAEVATAYSELLSDLDLVTPPAPVSDGSTMSWFCYVITLSSDVDRALLMRSLADRGVPSRPYFPPIHLQPYFKERFGYTTGRYPHAEKLGEVSLALPFSGVMPMDDVTYVVERLAEALPEAVV